MVENDLLDGIEIGGDGEERDLERGEIAVQRLWQQHLEQRDVVEDAGERMLQRVEKLAAQLAGKAARKLARLAKLGLEARARISAPDRPAA